MSNVTQSVPFFAVASMEESIRFYVDGLGFEITHRWEPDGELRWCWLQNGGAALMLQQFPTEGHDSWVPEGPVGEGVSVYFICEDALELYREFNSRGLEPSTPMVGNRMWVTSLRDPDGYNLHFESMTDLPEDTRYDEQCCRRA